MNPIYYGQDDIGDNLLKRLIAERKAQSQTSQPPKAK